MRMFRIFAAMLALLCAVQALAVEAPADPRTIKFPGISFAIPKADRVVLDCGMPVYLLADPELPIVSISAMIRTGSVYDPQGKAGLAALTGTVMRSGGTGSLKPAEMDDELEFLASSVESSIGSDMGSVSMTTLKRNLERTLSIFSDVLLRPGFDEKRFEIAKKHTLEWIRRQNDDPKEIADREISRAIYAGHPLGDHPVAEGVSSITRKDLSGFHARFYRPENMIMAVSGDFDRSAMIALLNRIFPREKQYATEALPEVPQVKSEFSAEVLFAKKDVNQSVIRMGHLGITKDSPDLYAIRVLDHILGGSFTSRITMEVRTNQGLAYHAGAHFDVGRRFTGTFSAQTETKSESTLKAITLIRDIVAKITGEPVTEQELKLAKDYLVNSFLFGFTSPSSIVTQRARLEYYGYSPDFLDRYRDNISRVTADDVLRAARNHLKPDAFKIVVVGDDARLDKPLSTLGPVRAIKLVSPSR